MSHARKRLMCLIFFFYFKAFKQLQEAASNFERANEKYNSAKGKVADFERIMMNEGRVFDGALQELLNHATVEVSVAVLQYSALVFV